MSDGKDQNPAPSTQGIGRIMVVDDNRYAAKTTAILLIQRGDQVPTSHNGHDALKIARQARPMSSYLVKPVNFDLQVSLLKPAVSSARWADGNGSPCPEACLAAS
jgi:hypothetical protein